MNKVKNYIKNSYDELVHKVSWPNRSELSSSAVLVMVASTIMALIVWLVDMGFENIVKLFYGL